MQTTNSDTDRAAGGEAKPRLTVARYKAIRGLEGDAFNLDLLVNGKLAAHVSNDGNGGENRYDWTPSGGGHHRPGVVGQTVLAWVEALPAKDVAGYGPLAMNLDMAVDDVISAMLVERDMKRWAKRGIVLLVPGDEPGAFRSTSLPFTAANVARVARDFPTAEVVNFRFGPVTP